MMKSSIGQRVARLQIILDQVDELNDRARLLISLIEQQDREEKDQVRYGGVLGT